jgi:hypothetical protein
VAEDAVRGEAGAHRDAAGVFQGKE